MTNTVYIVDDKRIIRQSLEKTIGWQRLGFRVLGSAADAAHAMEDIRALRPDVLITDIRMPGTDGLSLAEQAKELLPHIEVVVITGYDRFEYARSSLRIGARDIILKPIKNEELETLLESIHRDFVLALQQEQSDESAARGGYQSSLGPLCRAVSAYVVSHLEEDIGLDSLARMYRVSPSHLSKQFKRETGQTFVKFLTYRRIAKACTLLSDPRHRVGEVGFLCGFHSPEHFSKTFKTHQGMTPAEYRRQSPTATFRD